MGSFCVVAAPLEPRLRDRNVNKRGGGVGVSHKRRQRQSNLVYEDICPHSFELYT